MKKSVIFIVDKNPAHRNLIKFNFERNRFTNIHAFPNAEECLYRMQKNLIPDFLVTGSDVGAAKIAAATEKGVQVISEEDYLVLLGRPQ